MKVNLKVDKEQVKKVGKISWRITKAVVITGVKGIVAQTAMKTINTAFEKGPSAIPKFDLDYVIGEEKPKDDKPKRKGFSKKKDEVEEILEEAVEVEVSTDEGTDESK